MARTSRLVGGVPSVGVGRPGRDGDARGVGRAPRAQWGLPASKTTRPRESQTKGATSSSPSFLAPCCLGCERTRSHQGRFSGLPTASLLTCPTSQRTSTL